MWSVKGGRCSSGHCTTNRCANGNSSLPVRDKLRTRHTLSTNTMRVAVHPKKFHAVAATHSGKHVPGPFTNSRRGRRVATTPSAATHAHRVVKGVVSHDCFTSLWKREGEQWCG